YKFLEGKPYSKKQIENGEKVAVITENTKNLYFGKEPSVVGKYIESDHVKYKVAGVVKNVAASMMFSYADMYLPYTVSDAYKKDKIILGWQSGYHAILLANSKDELSKLENEYQKAIGTVPPVDKYYTKVYSNAESYLAIQTRGFFGDEKNSGVSKFYTIASIILAIFILLPVLNLININTSRIMERASEIGVRKAFGASSNTLVMQFLIENIILTLLGGIISILLSQLIISLSNGYQLIPYAEFEISWIILWYSLLAFFIFGILSGVYAAWRMSRMKVVNALKAQ
ncbi:MAG TPA: FtsX-like permease family protein, partial [Cytophagaceae bacterium]